MSALPRRRAIMLGTLSLAVGAAQLAAQGPIEIAIRAKRFEYTPATATVRRGQPMVFLLTSEDRVHGFKMPDFGLRADIVPGQETRVALTPDKAGAFVFYCDVFCGDGHEDMSGTLIVKD
jgi:cytochrome c oxidase subunit 2